MEIKLLAFDLDGTLLDDYKSIPPENMDALSAAAGKGLILVPSSGRLYPFIPETVRMLPTVRYFITSNGGAVYDAVEDKTLYSAEILPERALQVLDYMDTLDVIYDCYAGNSGYMNRSFMEKADAYFPGPVLHAMLHSYTLKTREPVEDLREFIRSSNQPLLKLQMFFGDYTERKRQLALLPDLFPDLVITSSLDNNIEINSAEATKGRALGALCRALGLSKDEVMAFGDGSNDLEMLRYAGLAVAMENADPALKQEADYITRTNNQSGFAAALQHYAVI